ncbi:MAG: F0F1 ATP synthase subunit delta [Pseudobdellovibrionaceae bacterium]
MTHAPRPTSLLARRYAQALLDIAVEKKSESAVESDMGDLAAMLSEGGPLSAFIKAPTVSREDQIAVIEALAKKAKFAAHTTNFLKTLAENKRLADLPEIIRAYTQAAQALKGEMNVMVTTAYPLSAAQKKQLTGTLSKTLGQDVALIEETDPSLLGGMVLNVGSIMIDDSLKGKLERLKLNMKSGNNDNRQMEKVG